MKRLATVTFATALLASSAAANAWWGGPGWGSGWNDVWSDWWNDFFGDAYFDISLSMGGGGRGWGRGWNRWNDYYGYGPYWAAPWGYGYPVAGYPYATPVVPAAPVPTAEK